MRLRLWTAAVIFIGSYLPLSLILLAQDYKFSFLEKSFCFNFWSQDTQCDLPFAHPKFSIPIFIVCTVCFVLTLFVLKVVRTKHSIVIKSAKYVPSELMNYTLPYVVSFMGAGYQEEGKFLGILIFLFWIFWITHKSGQIILNPVLVVFGWRLHDIIYSFTSENKEHSAMALSKGDIATGDVVKQNSIQNVMIIRKQNGNFGD